MTILIRMLREDFEKQRKLLHDISNKLSIAQGNLSYFSKTSNFDLPPEIEKTQKYLKDSINSVKELRILVSQLEKNEL